MPSLATIDGLGDKAADAVVDAAKQGKFLSKRRLPRQNQSQQNGY